MSLKSIITRSQIASKEAISATMVLEGEPLVYSFKYNIKPGDRSVPIARNMKWFSMLKCFFRSYLNHRTPVVVLVRFYVSPPSYVKVSNTALRREKTPAVQCHEISDYVLSFIELLKNCLINSYRQIVKIEAEKYYSDKPRTAFQFMRWNDYENYKAGYRRKSHGKKELASGSQGSVQPEPAGNA